jgi:hypothetical protein
MDSNHAWDCLRGPRLRGKASLSKLRGGCLAKAFHLAQPGNDLVPTRNALGRQILKILQDPGISSARPETSI